MNPVPQRTEVLILAPRGRDASVAATLMREVGCESHICATLAELASALSDHQKLFLIQELLDLSYRQISEIETSALSSGLKSRMIADREEVIDTLQEDSRARQARLLQADNG